MVWINDKIDENGRVIVRDVSLVAVADIRPVSLGERIRRYMRTPKFAADQLNFDGYDEDDVLYDMDENPLSPHELRSDDLKIRVHERRAKKAEDDKKALIAKQKAEMDEFRSKYNALKNSLDEPPLPFEDAST